MSGVLRNFDDLDNLDFSRLKHIRIGIVTAEWNNQITSDLYNGALSVLHKAGLNDTNIISSWVPGAFELAFRAKSLIANSKADAVICIGCVIKGDTPHFDFISQAAANGIMQVGLETGKVCIFGVLTTNSLEQALERSGGKFGNKGEEAAVSALKMLL